MPNYDFKCKKCELVYTELVSFDKTGKYKKVKCPACQSSSKTHLMSAPGSSFAQPVGTDLWNRSHGYRYGHTVEGAKAERKIAESKSHVGKNPYRNIDDISSGKNFGPVQ